MKRWVWMNGRLSWPFVIALVYLSVSLLLLDYIWRVIVIPFDTLLIYATVAVLGIATTLIALYRALRGRRAARTP
jgi:hypothetical protein